MKICITYQALHRTDIPLRFIAAGELGPVRDAERDLKLTREQIYTQYPVHRLPATRLFIMIPLGH